MEAAIVSSPKNFKRKNVAFKTKAKSFENLSGDWVGRYVFIIICLQFFRNFIRSIADIKTKQYSGKVPVGYFWQLLKWYWRNEGQGWNSILRNVYILAVHMIVAWVNLKTPDSLKKNPWERVTKRVNKTQLKVCFIYNF